MRINNLCSTYNTVNFKQKNKYENKNNQVITNSLPAYHTNTLLPGKFTPVLLKTNIAKRNNQIPFRGTPEPLNAGFVYNAEGAIRAYDCLREGKYLDIHDDNYNPENKEIREANLAFLDNLYTESDRQKFIEHYQKITGFPDLAEVSRKIENEYADSIRRTSQALNSPEYLCISAGFDGTCSVGKRRALPGSDVDKPFIILRGTDNAVKNELIVNKFKGELWKNTDQRLVSYNHDTSFPTVMTVSQVKNQIREINNRTMYLDFDSKKMENLVETEYKDLEKAAEYNILISDVFKKQNKYFNQADSMTKEDVKNFAYFIESLRDGKKVISTYEAYELVDSIKDYDFYKYSNVAQMKAMQNAISSGKEQKTKIIKRQMLESSFKKWPIDEQYNFVKTLIKYSCEDQSGHSEYFNNDYDVKAKYKPLLGRLTKGDRDELFLPEFDKIQGGVKMKYGKSKQVCLYSGYNDRILWVDSSKTDDITRVLEDIDKIKTIKQFNNVEIIQCPRPDSAISGFGPISHYTANGSTIYEARV